MMSDKLGCKASYMKTVTGHRSDNVLLQEYIDHANNTLKLKSAKILQIFANDDDFVLIESAKKQMKADDSNKANTAGP
jgi:hypothetical protein